MTTVIESTAETKLTDEEQRRAEVAAQEVFKAHGVTAAWAYGEFEALLEANKSVERSIWLEAQDAAIKAACYDWSRQPEDLVLVLA